MKPPREIQLFPCAISRATGSSTGSLSNQSELWSVEERSDQADWQTDGEPQRGSNDSVVSHEPSRPAGLASSLGSILYDGASVQENELPPTKRQRKMTIRYDRYEVFNAKQLWMSSKQNIYEVKLYSDQQTFTGFQSVTVCKRYVFYKKNMVIPEIIAYFDIGFFFG